MSTAQGPSKQANNSLKVQKEKIQPSSNSKNIHLKTKQNGPQCLEASQIEKVEVLSEEKPIVPEHTQQFEVLLEGQSRSHCGEGEGDEGGENGESDESGSRERGELDESAESYDDYQEDEYQEDYEQQNLQEIMHAIQMQRRLQMRINQQQQEEIAQYQHTDLAQLIKIERIQQEQEEEIKKRELRQKLDIMRMQQEREEIEAAENAVGHITLKRVANQLKDIRKNPPINWRVFPHQDKWYRWTVEVQASEESPFHSIPINIKVVFPNNYPNSKPKIKVQRPQLFFHPNVYQDGRICEQNMNSISPTMTIRERIEGFLFILNHPNPESPANNTAAALCRQDFRSYRKKAFNTFRQIKCKR